MSIKVAELFVAIGADTKNAEQGFDRVEKGMSALGRVGTTALGTALGGALYKAGQAVLGLGGQAVTAYGDFERLGMSLEALVAREALSTGKAKTMGEALAGAGDRAKELLNWTQKLAIESPFTQQGVADAFRLTMAYGFTTKEAQRLTQAMIDFSSGSGQSEYSMQRIALALGQIKAKGKLAGQEVLQLTEAGLNVNQILADYFGKSTQEIVKMREQGLIPANQAIEAIVSTLENQFGGAAARQAGTLSGLVNSLQDLKNIGLRELFGPTFKEFQGDLEGLVKTLQDPGTLASIRGWGEEMAQTARKFVDAGGQIMGTFLNLETGSKAAVVGLGLLALNANNVVTAIGGLRLTMVGLSQGFGAAMSAWQAGLSLTTSLQVGFGSLAVTIGAVSIALVALAAVWISWNENVEKTNRLGAQATSNTFGKMFTDIQQQGAGAVQTTDEFVAAMQRVDAQIAKSGFAGLFINKSQIKIGGLQELSQNLVTVTDDYDLYAAQVKRAAESIGYSVVQDQNGIRILERRGLAVHDITGKVNVLSRDQYANVQASQKQGEGLDGVADSANGAAGAMGGFAGSMDEAAAAAAGLQAEQERLKGQLGELNTIIGGQFGNENKNFADRQEKINKEIADTKKQLGELGATDFISPEAAQRVNALTKDLRNVTTEMYNLSKSQGVDWKTVSSTKDLNSLGMAPAAAARMEELRAKAGALESSIRQLGGAPYVTKEQQEKIDEMRGKLGELQGELDATATEHEMAMKRMAFSMLQERAASDGLTQNEVDNLAEVAKQWGLWDSKTAQVVKDINGNVGRLDTDKPKQFADYMAGIMGLSPYKRFDIEVFISTYGKLPGAVFSSNGKMERCFVGETLVSTPNGPRMIEDILVGDKVWTYTLAGQMVASNVVRVVSGPRDDLLRITATNGQAWICSPNHPFQLANGQFVEAAGLVPGCWLRSPRGEYRVKTIFIYPGTFTVFDITVDHQDHTFIAGGVVVHNKEAGFAGGGRPPVGEVSVVGERGKELFFPDSPGYIANASTTDRILRALENLSQNGGGGGNQVIQPVININESRDARRAARQVAVEIGRLQG